MPSYIAAFLAGIVGPQVSSGISAFTVLWDRWLVHWFGDLIRTSTAESLILQVRS